jgi:hypothetical protein
VRVLPVDRSGVDLKVLVADLSSEPCKGEPDLVVRLGSERVRPPVLQVVLDRLAPPESADRRLISLVVVGWTSLTASSGRRLSSRAMIGVRSRSVDFSTLRKTRSSSLTGRSTDGGAVFSGSEDMTAVSSRFRSASSPRFTRRERLGLAKSRSETTFQAERSMSAIFDRPFNPRAESSGRGRLARRTAPLSAPLPPPAPGRGKTSRRGV